MGITYSVGNCPNQQWPLGDRRGNWFEDLIYNILSKELRPFFKQGVRISHTPYSNDWGKDIIITSPIDLENLMGQSFHLKEQAEIKIYIECKSSDKSRISFDKISSNAMKSKNEKIDYFVLITNASIIPSSYYFLENEFKIKNIDFILIDQFLLVKYLKSLKLQEPEIDRAPLSTKYNTFYAEYQVIPNKLNGYFIYDIYLVCRNYSKLVHRNSIQLMTDKNWKIEEENVSFEIEPNRAFSKKITIKREEWGGLDDLIIKFKTDQTETLTHISGISGELTFEPPFVGDGHKKYMQLLIDKISDNITGNLLYLWGDAGIGKSRIVQEVLKNISDSIYDIFIVKLKKAIDIPILDLENFLYEKGYIHEKGYANFYEVISKCSHQYRKAVIVIDDCHYGTENLWKSIKKIKLKNIPVDIILCGRTDYSEGDKNFFSFVQWTLEKFPDNGGFVKPLSEKETKNLIKVLINQVPNIVLDKIYNASMNNPLFIVQFIEYLLECHLVELVNRNTVGIVNISSFSSHMYIPKKINDIYEQRISHLLKEKNGKEAYEFLMILSIFGGQIPIAHVIKYLDEELDIINILLKRKYIRIGNNENYIFIHESLFLFIQKKLNSDINYKKSISYICFSKKKTFLDPLPNYEKGRLSLWNGNRKDAKAYFAPLIKMLEAATNYSNYNIKFEIFEYLYDVYTLYKGKSQNKELLKRIISTRLYITLHYLTPVSAIAEVNYGLKLFSKSNILKQDKSFKYTILSFKAHALLDAGFLSDGEMVLKELLSEYVVDPNCLEAEALFNLADRLSGAYSKYNCFELALNYNNWEMKIAEKLADNNLIIIAHRTRSKVFFFKNPTESKNSLDFAFQLLNTNASPRIDSCNQLAQFAFEIYYNTQCNWDEIITQTNLIKSNAILNTYNRVTVRCYLILSVCYLKKASKRTDLIHIRKFIQDGMDACIQFGTGGYIWQFYNLLAIVDTRLGYETDHIDKLFETVFSMLSKQNLLYIGNRDLCYSNLMVISNIGFFYQQHHHENEFMSKMSKITYIGYNQVCDYKCDNLKCGYICSTDTNYLKKQYLKAENQQLLFTEQLPKKPLLRDNETKYFIAIL